MDVKRGLVFVEDLACTWSSTGFGLFVEPVRKLHQ
jgi:hypothetical protein